MSPGMVEMFTPCFLAWLMINVSDITNECLLRTVELCSTLSSKSALHQVKVPYTQRCQDSFSWFWGGRKSKKKKRKLKRVQSFQLFYLNFFTNHHWQILRGQRYDIYLQKIFILINYTKDLVLKLRYQSEAFFTLGTCCDRCYMYRDVKNNCPYHKDLMRCNRWMK